MVHSKNKEIYFYFIQKNDLNKKYLYSHPNSISAMKGVSKMDKNKTNNDPKNLDTPLNDQTSGIPSDTSGSYTGVPEDGGEPIQDADDL